MVKQVRRFWSVLLVPIAWWWGRSHVWIFAAIMAVIAAGLVISMCRLEKRVRTSTARQKALLEQEALLLDQELDRRRPARHRISMLDLPGWSTNSRFGYDTTTLMWWAELVPNTNAGMDKRPIAIRADTRIDLARSIAETVGISIDEVKTKLFRNAASA